MRSSKFGPGSVRTEKARLVTGIYVRVGLCRLRVNLGDEVEGGESVFQATMMLFEAKWERKKNEAY